MKDDEFLTLKEVADLLRVEVRTVKRLIDDGELKAVRVASRWRVRASAVQEYLKKHETGGEE